MAKSISTLQGLLIAGAAFLVSTIGCCGLFGFLGARDEQRRITENLNKPSVSPTAFEVKSNSTNLNSSVTTSTNNNLQNLSNKADNLIDKKPISTQRTETSTPIPLKVERQDCPASASAKCRDGTCSYSRNRRGTCSHHGGVAVWY